jgi:hypothetical protein
LRNIELLVGVALPLFLTGVFLQDQLTGSGHWTHPLESAFFEWLSLVPLLAFLGFLHTMGVAVVVAVWPRAANRLTVVLGAVLMVPLLLLAGRPLSRLTVYAIPLAIALAVYGLASRIPGSRSPPTEDLRTAPLSEEELLGHPANPWVVPTMPPRPPEVTPPAAPSQQAR